MKGQDTMTDAPILEMRNISKAFGGVQALRDVSFSCRKGKVHALLGENGAGKSTLIKILAGAYQADSGEIVFKGRRYAGFTAREAMATGISIIYQELNLVQFMTVAENIFLGREPRNRLGVIDTRRMAKESADLLDRLGIRLSPSAQIGDLTVASQQMVEIAKALSQNADLIVMDEPSAILAGQELDSLFATIRSLVEQGVTIIYISHRLNEVFEIADDVTVLKDGRVVGAQPIGEVTRARLIQMMVGRPLEEIFPRAARPRGAPVLTATNVTTERLPHPASLTLYEGEILGLAGMVGAGRTEVARALFGADALRSGKILLKDTLIQPRSPKEAVEAGLALVPEDRKTQGLFLEQSIRSNITLSSLDKLTRFGVIQRGQETETIERAQRELSIDMASPELEAQYLSGGNQQKVVLAKWLQTSPSVIIFDEPTRGVDVGAKFEIYQLMRQLAERGVAILMISSDLVGSPRHERPDSRHARAQDCRRACPRRGQRRTDHRARDDRRPGGERSRRERNCVVSLRARRSAHSARPAPSRLVADRLRPDSDLERLRLAVVAQLPDRAQHLQRAADRRISRHGGDWRNLRHYQRRHRPLGWLGHQARGADVGHPHERQAGKYRRRRRRHARDGRRCRPDQRPLDHEIADRAVHRHARRLQHLARPRYTVDDKAGRQSRPWLPAPCTISRSGRSRCW